MAVGSVMVLLLVLLLSRGEVRWLAGMGGVCACICDAGVKMVASDTAAADAVPVAAGGVAACSAAAAPAVAGAVFADTFVLMALEGVCGAGANLPASWPYTLVLRSSEVGAGVTVGLGMLVWSLLLGTETGACTALAAGTGTGTGL